MKTEQEQIEEIVKILLESSKKCLDANCDYCDKQYEKDCAQYRKAVALVQAGYGDVSEYKAEIERLKAENEKLLDSIESVQAGRCRLRCPLTEQAVKEFAERLKKYSYTDNCFKDSKWHRCVLVSDIDELIGGKEK